MIQRVQSLDGRAGKFSQLMLRASLRHDFSLAVGVTRSSPVVECIRKFLNQEHQKMLIPTTLTTTDQSHRYCFAQIIVTSDPSIVP